MIPRASAAGRRGASSGSGRTSRSRLPSGCKRQELWAAPSMVDGASLFLSGRFVIRSVLRAGLALLVIGMTGCAMSFDATELGVPTSMAQSAHDPVPAGAAQFSVTKHPVYMFWG